MTNPGVSRTGPLQVSNLTFRLNGTNYSCIMFDTLPVTVLKKCRLKYPNTESCL